MTDSDRLLVIAQPVLAPIRDDEIEAALPDAQRAVGWRRLDVVPARLKLGASREIDWTAVLVEQERLFAEQLDTEIQAARSIAYFGLAPIPVAMHLGYRIERTVRIDVYQRHHAREGWAWPAGDAAKRPRMKRLNLPRRGSSEKGPVVIRVSTSHEIHPAETAGVVPGSLADVDVGLQVPHEDALATPACLADVVSAFNQALARVKALFPNLTAIHLFAAVPVGLAFRLGAQINPTIYPPVVTYQYWAKASPRYQRAIVLAEGLGETLVSAADQPRDHATSSNRSLPIDLLRKLCEAVVTIGLQPEELRAGIDPRIVASFRTAASPAAQVLADLDALNRLAFAVDGTLPLREWLKNALLLRKLWPEAELFQRALDLLPG